MIRQDDGGRQPALAGTVSSATSSRWSDFQTAKKQRDMEKESLHRRELEQLQQIQSEEKRAREHALADQLAMRRERERQRADERAARERDEEADFDLMGQSNMMTSFEQYGVLS